MPTRMLILVVVIVLVALNPPSLSAKGGAKPPSPPPDPAIAYLENGNLMVANDDGSNQTLVLAAARGINISAPGWSPDGTALVFSSNIAGPGVYTIQIDGTGLTKIAALNGSTASTPPVWSPVPAADGHYKIAFDDRPRNGDGSLGLNEDIFLVNPDGSGLENLTQSPDIYEASPTWAPSATRLAVWDIGDQNGILEDIVVLDLGVADGGLEITGEINLTSEADVPGGLLNDASLSQPKWAKLHDKIIVRVRAAPELNGGSDLADLWIIDLADPANPTNLTQTPDVYENHASWSSDDARIVYGVGGLFVRPAGGSGSASRIVRSGGFPDWRR